MKPLVPYLLVSLFVGVTLAATAQTRQAISRGPMASTLRIGDKAPDFKLKTSDGQGEVRLSSFAGKRPVVLVFGSFT